MGIRKINESTLTAIGNAIRSKTGGSALINPEDMATEIESISGGGARSVSGTFTIATRENLTLTIVHNLGTPKIALFVRPLSLVANSGYYPMFLWAINKDAFIQNGETWEIDLRGYNSAHFPDVLHIDPSVTDFCVGWLQGTPWSSQSIWDDATNPGRVRSFTFTETSFSDSTSRWWDPGTYIWTAIALE